MIKGLYNIAGGWYIDQDPLPFLEAPVSTNRRTTIPLGDIEIRFLVEADDSEGAATVFECQIRPDAKVPAPHSHDGFEETVYGLAGVTTFTVDGETRELGTGDALCIRRGQVHHFVNHGTIDSCFLSVATPGVFGPDYFLEIRDVLVAAAGGPPDLAALLDVMRRHGLTPVAPIPAS
jgi:quercetin dioxygenase-like cupin family protein